jgi:hypothetical protein
MEVIKGAVNGTALKFLIPLVDSASRPDYRANPTIVAGDVKVVRYTSSAWNVSNITTLPSAIAGATTMLEVSLSATEMTADDDTRPIAVVFIDAAGGQWDDQTVIIRLGAIAAPGDQMALIDDAITASKHDESTSFPVASADSGSTQIARTGADADTLETLSDQVDLQATAAALTTHDGKLDTAQADLDTITGTDGVTLATAQANYAPSKAGDQMALIDDAITAAKYNETDAFPVASADTGATQIARTGADADTLETLSDQIDLVATSAALATHDGKLDTVDSNLDALITTVGVAGAGLSDLGGMSTGMQAEVEAEVTDALVAIDLDHLSKVAAAPTPTIGSNLDKIMNKDGSQTFNQATDSLEAIVDAGGAADWTTGEREQIRDALGVDGTKTAATGGQLQTLDSNVDLVLADTADMQPKLGTPTDLGDGTTLSDMLTGIAGKTAGAGSYLRANDSLEAVRDRGDAAWITGGGTGLSSLASGTAQSGAVGYIQLATGEPATDDYFNGTRVLITSGTGAGQSRVIKDYTGSSRQADVTPNWTTAPDGTSLYEVQAAEANMGAILREPLDGNNATLKLAKLDIQGSSPVYVNATSGWAVDIDSDADVLRMTCQTGGGTVMQLTAGSSAGHGIVVNVPNDTGIALDLNGGVVSGIGLQATGGGGGVDIAEIDAIQTTVDAIEVDTQDLQTQIGTAGAGLSDLGGMSTGMKAEIEAEATDALVAYDPPTTAEMDARTLVAANYFDPAADTVALVTQVDQLGTQAKADVNAEADTALSDINLDHLLAVAVAGTDVIDDSVIAQMASKSATADWDTFDNTTDSLEAIRDNQAAGSGDWTTTEKENIRHSLGVDGTKTAPTGGYGRIGDPAGASLAVDIAAVKSDTGSIVAKLPSGTISDFDASVDEVDLGFIKGADVSGNNASLKLKLLDIRNTDDSAFILRTSAAGKHGFDSVGGSGGGDGMNLGTSGGGRGLTAVGEKEGIYGGSAGTGGYAGIHAENTTPGGTNGSGFKCTKGTAGAGLAYDFEAAEIQAIEIDTNAIFGKLPTNKIMGSSVAADMDGVINGIDTKIGTPTFADIATDIANVGASVTVVSTKIGTPVVTIAADIANLNDLSAAEVNAEVDTALDELIAEPVAGTPAATSSVRTALARLYSIARNKGQLNSTAGEKIFFNSSGVSISKKAVSDNGTVYEESAMTGV